MRINVQKLLFICCRNAEAIYKLRNKLLFRADESKINKRTIGSTNSSANLIDRSRDVLRVIVREITYREWCNLLEFTIVPTVSIKGDDHVSQMFWRYGRAQPPILHRNGWLSILSVYRVIL